MNQIWPKNNQNLRYLHYWQSYRVEMGTKMSGGNPSSWYFRFLARPCGFRAFRNEKLIKFRLFWRFLALFERFLDYNSSVTTWSRMGPVNLNRGVHSWNFGTLYNPLASSIVIWNKKWAPSSSVIWRMIDKIWCFTGSVQLDMKTNKEGSLRYEWWYIAYGVNK